MERGLIVSYETIRCWAKKCGPYFANCLRRKPPNPSDIRHLDKVVVTIGGRKYWLWRAVDQDGYVLDEIAQIRRNTKGCETPSDPADEEAEIHAEAYCHRRTSFLRSHAASSHVHRRASITQRVEQSRRELSSSSAETGASDAAVPLAGRFATFRQCLLRRPKSVCPNPPEILGQRSPSASTQGDRTLEGRGRKCCLITPRIPDMHSSGINLTSLSINLFQSNAFHIK